METCKNFKARFQNQLQSSAMFVKFLKEDFSSYLRILKENLGKVQEAFADREVITIIGPNGKYDIDIKMSQEAVILEKGGAEFSRAHHLCNTDKLMFTCGCQGLFFVLIYDKNGKAVGNRSGPSQTEAGGVKHKRDIRNEKEDQSECKNEKLVASSSRGNKKDTSDSSGSETNNRQIIEVKLKKTFISHWRPVSDVEVKMALRAAQHFHSSRPYFLKQMKTNNVYRVFTVIVPTKFARVNLSDQATKISLRVSGKTGKWDVNCKLRV